MATNAINVRRRAPLLGLGAGVAAAAVLALVLLLGNRGSAPGVTPSDTGGVISAACVEQYSPTTLTARDFAFDGTVTAVSGEKVTFAVNASFVGAAADSVTLDAPGMTGTAITSGGGPNLTVGERYLVAGDSTFVWACGFTQPYDAEVAEDWAAAAGS